MDKFEFDWIQILWGIIGTGFGYFVKLLNEDIKGLKMKVNELELDLAQNYNTKEEMRLFLESHSELINKSIEHILNMGNSLDKRLERIEDKLDKKADK